MSCSLSLVGNLLHSRCRLSFDGAMVDLRQAVLWQIVRLPQHCNVLRLLLLVSCCRTYLTSVAAHVELGDAIAGWKWLRCILVFLV